MRIGIVGLGLIGGSLAAALSEQGHELWGVSRHAETIATACAKGWLQHGSTDLSALIPTELVFVCAPIPQTLSLVQRLTAVLGIDTVITDVASVKGAITAPATAIWPRFVGGHPMAGDTATGLAAARADLFRGRPYVLTPIATTDPLALERVQVAIEGLSVSLHTMSPDNHDATVAWISHLPVVVSAALVASVGTIDSPELAQAAATLASSGFRDTSRVGAGNPALGVAMAEFNTAALLDSLHHYRHALDQLIHQIEQADWPALETQLHRNRQTRRRFCGEQTGQQ